MATDTLSTTMQDYLESIYRLEMEEGTVRVKSIAEKMGVKMPSVTSALQTLEELGLVDHRKYQAVELTHEGRSQAQAVFSRHQALRSFLADILQIDDEQAEAEACQMEHAISTQTLCRLLALVDFIKKCPRGGDDWLEHLKGRWEGARCVDDCASCIENIDIPDHSPFAVPEGEQKDIITLDQLAPGQTGTIVKLGGRGSVRRRIMDMGFTPGSELEVERLAPLGDPMEFKIRGYHLSLRHEEAANIHVRPR
ncbi:MAG: metal-dependent transcriptional regulator [Armatimonadota bacterium]